MSDETVQYKDITFSLDKLGKLEINAERDEWGVGTVNDMESMGADQAFSYKPRSLADLDNDFSPENVRRYNMTPTIETDDGSVESAGNITIREYDNYLFIFDMKLDQQYRGMGGGELMIDIFKGLTLFSDKEYAGGFVGDGNTREFLKSQGFQRARFESWTNSPWNQLNVSGDLSLNRNYYDIPQEDRFGMAPTAGQIAEELGIRYVEPKDGEPWTTDREFGTEEYKFDSTFGPRVRESVADPYWESGWSSWFKIKRREIDYDDSALPVTNRSAPVIDRIQDPNFSIF